MAKSFTLTETVDQYLAGVLGYWPSWGKITNLDTRWMNLHQIISGLHKECEVPRTILGISMSNNLESSIPFDSLQWQLNMTWGGVSTQSYSSEREAFMYAVVSAYVAGCRVEAMWVDAILGLYEYRREDPPGSRRYVVSENKRQYFAKELNMTHEKINRASQVACSLAEGIVNDGDSRSAQFRYAIQYLRNTLQLKVNSTKAVKTPTAKQRVVKIIPPPAAIEPGEIPKQAVSPLQSTSIIHSSGLPIATKERARAKKNWQKLFASPVFRGNGKIMNLGETPDDRNDWLEAIAPHIPAAYLINAYAAWKRSTETLSFMPWLDTVYIPEALNSGDINREREALQIKRSEGHGVEYLDQQQRKEKIVRIKNGFFIDSLGYYYNTADKSTMNSGNGWAIFVMDKNYTIYSDSHKSGMFHHSSFLSGGRVLSAGEIAVDRGRLVAITCKSGHYRPKKQEMTCFLDRLSKQGVDLRGVPVQMEWVNTPSFYEAEQVLRSNGNLSPRMSLPAPSTPPVCATCF